jgi:molecular chaperone GrpE
MHDESNTAKPEDAARPDETASPPDNTAPSDDAAAAPDSGPLSLDDAPPVDSAWDPSEPAPPPDHAAPSDEATPPVDHDETDEIDRLQRERDEYYERLLRTSADFDNYRKRTDRERRELAQHAATGVLMDLLPLVDDLERALAARTQDGDVDRRGVEIIHKQLLDLLDKRGVARIEALGADFDPHLHQAVAHEPSETHRDGEVIEELRRGYTLRDRLLRASMVKVAKA